MLKKDNISKIVIRNHFVCCISSNFSFNLQKGYDKFDSIVDLLCKYSIDKILKVVYEEKEYEYKQLINYYNEFINGKENAFFSYAYKIKGDFIAIIDKNISILKLEKQLFSDESSIIPWYYASKKVYISDLLSSLHDDDLILEDILNLSMIDLCLKYGISSNKLENIL